MQITPKLFAGLAVAAGVSLTAAGVIYATNNTWSVDRETGDKLFPKLAEVANTVAAVELQQGTKTLTMTRQGDRWLAREHGDYPLRTERVRTLIVKLARTELIEAKTRKPDRYELLGLGDPKVKETKARLIRLRNDGGGVIVEAVLGKKRWDAFGSGRSSLYVRKPSQPQTWLTNLNLDPELDINAWVDTKLVDIEPTQIRALTLENPGEEPLKFRKGDGEDAKFQLADVPDGAKLKDSASADRTVRGFASIELEDIRKLEITPAGGDVRVARLETADGLAVTFRLRKQKDAFWLSVFPEGSGEAAKKAETLNARVKGWEFKIPSWKADALFKTRSDFFETS